MPSAAERVDQRPELLPHLRVEADRRLVEQHEPRAVDERAGDQQPPPHAARELVDAGVAPVDELRHLERALDRVVPLVPADPVEVREDEQVLRHRQRRVEVVELRATPSSARACFDSSGSVKPSTSSSPSSAIACAVSRRMVVDLPAPFGPSSPTQVPDRHVEIEPAVIGP